MIRNFIMFFRIALILAVFSGYQCLSQKVDTLKITTSQAEEKFLQNNLQLLASRFNIEASKALIVQAKLWNNPNITVEQNIYNRFTKKWFDVTSSGNTEVQLQQLFLLAGKRDKNVKLAEMSKLIAEQQLYTILRGLKFTLRKDLIDLYFFEKEYKFFDSSIVSVSKTIESMEAMLENRTVLMTELMRLKALLFNLKSSRLDIQNQISDIQQDLHVLISDSSGANIHYVPDIQAGKAENVSINNYKLDDLISNGLDNRPDYKLAQSAIDFEQRNLEYQKALAVPDLTVGGRWARQGGYITNYFALSLSIDIPVLNRNQGNIQLSEATIETNKVQKSFVRKNIEKEINSAYKKATDAENLYNSLDKSFAAQYTDLVAKTTRNYEMRNITIIEYTDFISTFITTMIQLNQLQNNRIDAIETLNYTLGYDLISF